MSDLSELSGICLSLKKAVDALILFLTRAGRAALPRLCSAPRSQLPITDELLWSKCTFRDNLHSRSKCWQDLPTIQRCPEDDIGETKTHLGRVEKPQATYPEAALQSGTAKPGKLPQTPNRGTHPRPSSSNFSQGDFCISDRIRQQTNQRTLKIAITVRAILRVIAVLSRAAVALGISSGAFAGPSDRVLVIRNGNSPVSQAVADDYASRRGITNVLTINCQDAVDVRAETISFSAYQKDIEEPIRAFLASHSNIDFIVLTKGIPLRIVVSPTPTGIMNRYAVDSHLAALGYDKLPDAVRVDFTGPKYFADIYRKGKEEFHAQAWANRFWNSPEPFSHTKFGGYLVTRLDGYTETDAKALTTRSLQAEQAARAGEEPRGEILLDTAPQFGFIDRATQLRSIFPATTVGGQVVRITDESDFATFNSDMKLAAEKLTARGVPVELDVYRQFVGARVGLMGYMSWGSNDPGFNPVAYHSLAFAPGAVGDTAVSSSGRTFFPTPNGQSLIGDLIAQGLSGGKGYTDEPLLQAIASPSILFDRYTRGWTLAESLYAASAFVGWEDIVIGDPLMRAYPRGAK